ncbi:thiol reductant ABC exporter subunit CydC [Arcanobacterium haemolyticum]|nr:thiol reductant ABC exporter subunit CydC [Arcanobacterium haemolyticum]
MRPRGGLTVTRTERRAVKRAIELLEINRAQFLWSVLAGSAGLACSVGLAAVSAWLIAKASQMPPVLDLAVAATSVRALGVGKAVFRYLNRIASHNVALYGMSSLRTSVYEALADSPTDVVTSVRRGDLLARTGKDIDTVGDLVVRSLQPTAVAIVVSLISVLIVALLSPIIGLILLVGLLISGLIAPMVAMRGVRSSEKAQVNDRANLAATSLAILESASELRISGRLAAMESAAQETEHKIFRNRDQAAKPNALAAALDVGAMALAVAGALIVGTQQVGAGTLDPLALAVVVLTPLAAFEATQVMPMAAIQLVRSARASERIVALLDAASHEHNVPARPDDLHEDGLVIDNLTIGWPDGPDVAGPLSMSIQRGENLAIVGPSGIGKSTLLYTLAGMLHPHEGHVRLDGREISYLPRAEVSRTLTLTAEDAHIFETTVLENIRVARGDVTVEEAEALLAKVGLGSWLAELPDGVNTMLGSDAATVSGGERRRLLLARALASQADFLLLDEPGEHLDPETADTLIRDLLTVDEDRTVILVTHRLAPLDAADRIIVLAHENGATRIAAAGTHDELRALLPDYRWSAEREAASTAETTTIDETDKETSR